MGVVSADIYPDYSDSLVLGLPLCLDITFEGRPIVLYIDCDIFCFCATLL